MALLIRLEWKEFPVNLEKVNTHFRSTLSSNFDGLRCDSENMNVDFKEDYSEDDETLVSNYWASINSHSFDITIQEIVFSKINDAIVFGNRMIVQAAVENVLLGITQAGKTKDVSDYLSNLQMYLRSGSLYAAISEIDTLKAGSIPSGLSPWVTSARLDTYKTQIQAFLSS